MKGFIQRLSLVFFIIIIMLLVLLLSDLDND